MISVIVPVYNVDNYLNRCLDSIINQSYKNFEIIIVDDGSTDKSPAICDSYSKKYDFISVIHQNNGGLSVARNTGILAAKGNFITYIDSDDLIHKDYLLILNNLIDENNANIACCNFKFFYEENELLDSNDSYKSFCISGYEATEKMLYGKFHGSSACAILMETSIAKNNLFTPNRYHEDDFITFKYYYCANKVAYTEKPLYYYFQRPGSIMHSKYGKSLIDKLDAADFIVEQCKIMNRKIKKAAIFKQFDNYNQVIYEFPQLKKIDMINYKRLCKVLNTIKIKLIFNNNLSKKNKLRIFILIISGINGLKFINKKIAL